MIRIAAWQCLRSRRGTPLREVDRLAAVHGLEGRDRGLLRALVGTEVRRRASLRAIVKRYTRTQPNAELAAHMRLGLAQVLFLDRVPDHAALSETGDAVARTVGFSKVKVVNAVLRAAQRDRRRGTSGDPRCDLVGRDLHLAQPVFRDPAEHPHLWEEDALSIPAHLMKRWSRRLGADRARDLARWFLVEPPLALRGVGVDRAELERELTALDVPVSPGDDPAILRCPASAAEVVLASEAFRSGRLAIQGETAHAAAALVAAREGERVLDLCAAPGGKTAVLAGTGARVIAVDRDPRRLTRLGANLTRLGLGGRVGVLAADGATSLAPAERFDAVLVDAPCSNTGVLGARPGARWRFGPASLAELGAVQERLFDQAASRVRPGGRLVWSTCSLEPEENTQRVRAFLGRRKDFELVRERAALPGQEGPGDGGYAALLTRAESG